MFWCIESSYLFDSSPSLMTNQNSGLSIYIRTCGTYSSFKSSLEHWLKTNVFMCRLLCLVRVSYLYCTIELKKEAQKYSTYEIGPIVNYISLVLSKPCLLECSVFSVHIDKSMGTGTVLPSSIHLSPPAVPLWTPPWWSI